MSAAGPAPPAAAPRAVLDSSALVPAWSRLLLSELATWRPAPFIPIWCEWIVAETWRVLTVRWLRERPLTTPADERRLSVAAGAMLRALLPVMEHVSVAPPFAPAWAGLADVDDLPVWTAAVRADAGYVVSQNVRDFPPRDADGLCRHGGVEFITPANFARDVLGLDPAAVAPRPIPADAYHHARRP